MNDESGSRPKIHKLPQLAANENEIAVSRTILIVCIGLLVAVLIPAISSYHKVESKKIEASLSPNQLGVLTPAAGNDTVMVHDDAGKVIGQITPMPSDASHAVDVKTNPKADQNSGKELMGIISKH